MSDDYLNKPISIGGSLGAPGKYDILANPSIRRNLIGKLFKIFSAPSRSALSSPYLNYDPRYFQKAQPEFIFPEGASKQRGRFELAFSQIGSRWGFVWCKSRKKIHELSFPFRSVMIGAGIGGVAGFYNGIKAANLAQQTGKLRRTQLINHVMKQGSATANTLGTIAVLYSAFGVLLSLARGEDDEANTIVAGAATGLMYKSTAGLRKCMIGGGVGLALSSLWVLYNVAGSKQKFNDFKQYV